MPEVVLYTRRGCHLCEGAKEVLEGVARRVPFRLVIVDIDEDPLLVSEFGEEVPVVFIDGRKAFKYRIDPALLEKKLR